MQKCVSTYILCWFGLLQEPDNPSLDRIAEQARNERQINVFAVGVGNSIDANQLRSLSGIRQPDGRFRRAEDVSWFRSPDFTEIDTLVHSIVDQVCGAIPGSIQGPCMYSFLLFLLFMNVRAYKWPRIRNPCCWQTGLVLVYIETLQDLWPDIAAMEYLSP